MTRIPLELTTSDRIKITRHPPSLPGTCVVCNRSADGVVRFFDFDASLDYYGAFYFCEPCMVPLAHAMGFIETSRLIAAEVEANELRHSLEQAEDELTYYRSFINSIRRLRPDIDITDIKSHQTPEQDDSGPEKSDRPTEPDNTRTDEPPTIWRS